MVITVQQLVKKGYSKILRWSLLFSFVIITNIFLFSPTYIPNPYTLEEEIFEVVEIPDDIQIPPPPQEIEMPKVPVQIEISDEASDEDTIEDTSFDFTDDIPPPATNLGGGTKVFYAFDDPPQVVYRAPVRYPSIAREAEMEGVVNVLIFVDERGNVFNVQVLSASVPQILKDEAVRSAWKWRFKPGKQRNQAVKTTISVPIQFTLRGR
jgi:periplasmic protein TonB